MSQQGYIGRNPGDGRTIVNRQTTHVTTGVQTSFTMAVGYEVGYLDVLESQHPAPIRLTPKKS